jgi:hypothetical protein
VKEQCVVHGWPVDWLADETVTLQLAVLDKKTKTQLLPVVSQSLPGSLSLCVDDVRVRVEQISEQKSDNRATAGTAADVEVQAVSEPRDHPSQFDIRVKLLEQGEHRLRVWVRDVEVSNSPFTVQVKVKVWKYRDKRV